MSTGTEKACRACGAITDGIRTTRQLLDRVKSERERKEGSSER